MKAGREAGHVETAARSAAALATVGCLCLWAVLLWYNPYRPPDGPASRLIGSLMIAAWIVGLVATWRRWLGWALAVFALAFFPLGLYLLGAPGPFAWIGILTLLYLAATLVWHRSRSRRRALDELLALELPAADPRQRCATRSDELPSGHGPMHRRARGDKKGRDREATWPTSRPAP